MLLNYLFVFFFLASLVMALFQLAITRDATVFGNIVESLFSSANTGFEISIGLAGVLTLWQGLIRVGEKSGIIGKMAKGTAPFFSVLFPSVPKGHPVLGTMLLNFSANMLGLDNAATPVGLQAMQELQKLNKNKERISDAMIMFLCINASGLTLLPVTIIMYRMQLGSSSPSNVFLPILIATAASTISAILMVAYRQRINLLQKAFIIPLFIITAAVVALFFMLRYADKAVITQYATAVSHIVLFAFVCLFIASGFWAKRNVFEDFIEGAKEGFGTAVKIIPYLVSILVAIGVFRASGCMALAINGIRELVALIGIEPSWVEGLPTMLMKPLSGSGARGMMIDAMKTFGPDSFIGNLVCTVQGASDTTFYVVAAYCGSVSIKYTRYTMGVSLIADIVGIVVGTLMCYLFFF